MQPRLMRSDTEHIVAGVCGGLGEYFTIDPVFVRLIFVLVTITSGLGLIVYPALWVAMPKARGSRAAGGSQQIGARQEVGYSQQSYVMQEAAMQGQTTQARPAPIGEPYRYDPLTGQPMGGDPTTGQTISLPADPNMVYGAPSPAPAAHSPQRRWRVAGMVLLGIGILALCDAVGIDTDFVFPLLMIVGGVLLLRRR